MFADKESFIQSYLEKFAETEGKTVNEGTAWNHYRALVMLLKEKTSISWAQTNKSYSDKKQKQVYYFSLEFLIGKLLAYYLMNLGTEDVVRQGLAELGLDLDVLIAQEHDAGLGNGGLGRLAACFLDSMAFLGIPGHGNGIRYRYGLLEQKIINGFQVEVPDNWLRNGYPWEIRKPDKAVIVRFKGNVRMENREGRLFFSHENSEAVRAVPYDVPIISFGQSKINNLRLWNAEQVLDEFDLVSFNKGDFSKSENYNPEVEVISDILYPEDSSQAGRELRLKQEYFFVAAGLASILRRYKKKNDGFKDFFRKVAVHINDTHPALCVPELMRLLMDEEGLGWQEAWNITVNTISYTNHTIMPEALEKWPVDLVKYLLPRIYLIIEEIDRRHRDKARAESPENSELLNNTAVIHDGYVYMANLAVIGSHSVNGVAGLHTEILKNDILKYFYRLYPYKFKSITNGVSHRRFLLQANPRLAALISESIGEGWIRDYKELEKLVSYQDDQGFLEKLAGIKNQNKYYLADYIQRNQGITIDPSSVFDIQVKRIHAYKRQLLNVLKIMDLYNRLKDDPQPDIRPFTFIFGGKAAPGYHYAKSVIKLITTVAEKVNNDPDIGGRLKVVFLENFNVSLAEKIYPAADISEQISTAGTEASGTGNMKFMMNGALTLGTLDGANVEMVNRVGADNITIFGLNADEVMDYHLSCDYRSREECKNNLGLLRILDQLINGSFSSSGWEFRDIYDSLLRDNDHYFVLKDFPSYLKGWQKLNKLYASRTTWFKISLLNIALSGIFSSDRTIGEYAESIWKI